MSIFQVNTVYLQCTKNISHKVHCYIVLMESISISTQLHSLNTSFEVYRCK